MQPKSWMNAAQIDNDNKPYGPEKQQGSFSYGPLVAGPRVFAYQLWPGTELTL
jgi:hypothetical protein